MKRLMVIFITTILISSCTSHDKEYSIDRFLNDSIKVDSLNVPTNPNQYYYPLKLFLCCCCDAVYDTMRVEWYSYRLRAMNEPLLFNKKPNKEVYRFLWVRSFNDPVVIRIEKTKNNYSLTWKQCSRIGDGKLGKMVVNKTKEIDKKKWETFCSLVRKADFWNLPTTEYNAVPGNDGSDWILEGVDNKRYHVVDRWTPEKGNYYNCCNYLIELTDLKIKKSDKY